MPSLKADPRPCETCGKSFQPYRQQVEKGNGRYCSRECRAVTQRKSVDRICQQCGKTFVVNTAVLRQKPSLYCSRECRDAHIRDHGKANSRRAAEQVPYMSVCPICGVTFRTRLAHFYRNGGKLFCSVKCGGIGRRLSPTQEETVRREADKAFKGWRRSVLVRDAFTCQECGFQGKKNGGELVAHHILGWASHPHLRTEVTNGITLCHTCHRSKHASRENSTAKANQASAHTHPMP